MAEAAPPRSWPALDLEPRSAVALPPDFDDTLALLLDDLAAIGIVSDRGGRRVYFGDVASRDAAASVLAVALCAHVAVRSVDEPDAGWAEKAQQTLTAVRVDEIVVAPPWDVPPDTERGNTCVIVIEPSTGFGTGHHQSTRLCLRFLQGLTLDGRTVVDVGTGSGILAIAAALAGASRVVAIDNDPDAARAARANADRNGVSDLVDVQTVALDEAAIAPADVVFANLTMIALRREREALGGFVSAGGTLIVSGFTTDQAELVADAFPTFTIAAREDEDDWVALRLRRM